MPAVSIYPRLPPGVDASHQNGRSNVSSCDGWFRHEDLRNRASSQVQDPTPSTPRTRSSGISYAHSDERVPVHSSRAQILETEQEVPGKNLVQLDGPHEFPPRPPPAMPRNPPSGRGYNSNTVPSAAAGTASSRGGVPSISAADLLRYCTTSLALRAKVDDGARENLVSAVGDEAAIGVIEFFSDEWVVDT
ncbi:hypothetical protein BDV95DRAFT_577245 [Massariosphaeria phaeospora]|uniref:Uncharacterized protein n=1 Tax=Massariosphaeria phaeospora TaxID=100035 RepID=A0A7C8M5P1_9PLEO|nr:hypothetical protein BDV95DRAFT_577245 [Massariosphaeria phaeospora]